MRCYRKILHISYKDHVTNEEVRAKIWQAIGLHEDLLPTVKRPKLQWYGHVSRSSGLAKAILQGTVKRGRRQGRQGKRWADNIREWTGLELSRCQGAVENREKWSKLVVKSSVVPWRPSRLRNRWCWWWWWGMIHTHTHAWCISLFARKFTICFPFVTKHLCPQITNKVASTLKILHFISCEKLFALQSRLKYYMHNNILSLHSRLVTGWQLWKQSDTL